MVLMIMFVVIFMIGLILLLFNFFISKKEFLDREKFSVFECGFEPISSSRLPFSINFYMIVILFLIFDVEVVFLFPIVLYFDLLESYEWLFSSCLILIILYLGLEFEKSEGSLKWML